MALLPVLLLLLAILAAGIASWVVLRREDGSREPEPGLDSGHSENASSPPPPVGDRRPSRPSPADARPEPEALWSPSESFPQDRQRSIEKAHVLVEMAPEGEGHPAATGEAVRAALLRVPGLYLRWESSEVRTEWLRSRLEIPPDADSSVEGQPGAPLGVVAGFLDRAAGFSAHFRPPVVVIGSEGWAPEGWR